MRRTILLILAAIVVAIGSTMVFLYVRGADQRAEDQYDTQEILKAVAPIAAGEKLADAEAAGKIELQPVPVNQILPGAMTSTVDAQDQVAVTAIFPGEQIIANRFGGAAESVGLAIKKGDLAISVNLTDPARVAGFVNPGSEVAIFVTGNVGAQNLEGTSTSTTRMLLERVTVLGVGSTTPSSSTTTTDESGATTTTEQLPRTLLTLSLSQRDAERVLFAQTNGDLAFGLLNDDSKVAPDAGVTAGDLFR